MVPIGESEKVTGFFLGGGKRIIQGSSPALEHADTHHPILEIAGSANWHRADRNLYVVELKLKIFEWEKGYFEANLHWIPGKPSVYVGVTGLTPEERFRKHLSGERATDLKGRWQDITRLTQYWTQTVRIFGLNINSSRFQSFQSACPESYRRVQPLRSVQGLTAVREIR